MTFIYAFFFVMSGSQHLSIFFFFNDTATTEIYTLSLHDALPISVVDLSELLPDGTILDFFGGTFEDDGFVRFLDRKSTRLNSSHSQISYAVFCLKKKKKNNIVSFTSYFTLTNNDCLVFSLSFADS